MISRESRAAAVPKRNDYWIIESTSLNRSKIQIVVICVRRTGSSCGRFTISRPRSASRVPANGGSSIEDRGESHPSRGSVRRLESLLPILHGTGRHAQELCEDRLARAQLSPRLFYVFRSVFAGRQAQSNRAAGKAFGDVFARSHGGCHTAKPRCNRRADRSAALRFFGHNCAHSFLVSNHRNHFFLGGQKYLWNRLPEIAIVLPRRIAGDP